LTDDDDDDDDDKQKNSSSNNKSIQVLRIGHRFVRDDRTVTHLCLVSRALGAEAIYLQEVEKELLDSVAEVNATWGGEFRVTEEPSWKKVVLAAKKEGRLVVHLTMYGTPLQERVGEMRGRGGTGGFLIVVGGPKVPGDIYGLADLNIAVTNQPHSEVAALAILLHELQEGKELKREFSHSKLKIVPQERGKRVES
jgi:tRNA (cytidine56-2'-O)-methyltransferase